MRQGWEIAQPDILFARNVVRFANGREQFRLFYGVDSKVGFKVQIGIQHLGRITGLLDDQGQDSLLHWIGRWLFRHRCAGSLSGTNRGGRSSSGEVGALVVYKLD